LLGLEVEEVNDAVVEMETPVGAVTDDKVVMLVTFITALVVGAAVKGLLVGSWLTIDRDVEETLSFWVFEGEEEELTAGAPAPLELLMRVPPATWMLS